MSGDALKTAQRSPSALTAMLDCVRGRTPFRLPQAKRDSRVLPFHCGKPPPAAEPSTLMIKAGYGRCPSRWAVTLLAGAPRRHVQSGREVTGHLEASVNVRDNRLFPGLHGDPPLEGSGQMLGIASARPRPPSLLYEPLTSISGSAVLQVFSGWIFTIFQAQKS